MRVGLDQRMMSIAALSKILRVHTKNPCQPVYLFSWKYGPTDRYTIYDMDKPRRDGRDEYACRGYAEFDYWIAAQVCNVPAGHMSPYTGQFFDNMCTRQTCKWSLIEKQRREFCPKCAQPISESIGTPGYKNALVRLLSDGGIYPSRVLDAWLQDDSRRYAANLNRIHYLHN